VAIIPKLAPKMYMYIGFIFALLGCLLALLAIAMIMGFVELEFSYILVVALTIGALLVATLSFHQLGKKRIPV